MSLSQLQLDEIREAKQFKKQTSRATVDALEEILFEPIKVLDHGFVRVIDYMGDDSAIVQAARVSYGKGTKKINEDKGLINYLMRHWHTTPFEMCEIKLHVKLPIFIARQWIRHRTANVNEYSARYSILDKEFYIPAPENLAMQSHTNRQGRGGVLEGEEAARVLEILKNDSEQSYKHYMEMLNLNEETNEVLDPSRAGLTRELARMNLPVNYYTQWYWKVDLNNLLHFLRLRADAHAQFEIREYANAIILILEKWLPLTFEAFKNYRLNSASISEQGMSVVKRMLAGEKVTQELSGMSKREWDELIIILEK
ncbi:FAD-dependent thymidylate synthase [Holosporaceae bacterium 'Namur']|nr:FAD-dependent thymidylate synthase [Holosporaceae bacterium 'Namur']